MSEKTFWVLLPDKRAALVEASDFRLEIVGSVVFKDRDSRTVAAFAAGEWAAVLPSHSVISDEPK